MSPISAPTFIAGTKTWGKLATADPVVGSCGLHCGGKRALYWASLGDLQRIGVPATTTTPQPAVLRLRILYSPTLACSPIVGHFLNLGKELLLFLLNFYGKLLANATALRWLLANGH